VGRMHLAAVWNSCCCKYLKVFRQCLPEGVQGLILLRLNFCIFSREIDNNRYICRLQIHTAVCLGVHILQVGKSV
jgi:hypothetical protein